jgi:hypothetical protein
VLPTTQCGTWGRELPSAHADLDFLRQHAREPQPARIFGAVQSHGAEHAAFAGFYPPLANVDLRITGPAGELTGKTDAQGRFAFANIVPGQYTLFATLESYRSEQASYTVPVPKNGCGTAFVAMFTDARVSGRVLNVDRKPAAGVEVTIEHADRRRYPVPILLTPATTDTEGRFNIRNLPAGELILGVATSQRDVKRRFLPTWWPGVTDRDKAGVIHLKPNEHRAGLIIRLGKPAELRRVRIRVVRPDGQPATDVKVTVGRHLFQPVGAEGKIEVELLAGNSYEVRAESGVRGVARGRANLGPTETTVTVVMSR